jgi:serine/threonine-protein kinase
MVIPRTVGKYEIVDAIGTGGMGTVYRAFDPTLERMVALKIVHFDKVSEVTPEQLSERFRNEARAVARLNHPAIVTIFDYDDQDPFGAYIAMEYVQGCALDDYVKQRPELHLEDAISAMHQVLGGLAYAHGKNVVHRDIKPSNLLVTRDGLVKITDFGIAKITPQSTTQTGLMVGTPQYMAPEQYMGGGVDHRCDIYAAGAVLFELLTGSPPFTGTSAEVMYKVCHEVPKTMSSVDATIPAVFDAIVAKALEKVPANRYASAVDFQQALRAGWQVVSPKKPPSPTLSQSARLIATAIHSQPIAPAHVAPLPGSPRASPDLRPVPGPGPLAGPSSSPPPLRAPAAAGSSSGPRTHSAPGSLAAWSREQLAEVEQQLIPLVGPLAKILVRDAAATTASRQELYRLLASHLQSPDERRKFLLAGARIPTGPGSKPAGTVPHETLISGLVPARPLTPELTQRACQALARYVGPLATILTRKAAQNASDEAHLYSLLAEKLTEEERERFLSDVAKQR